jgi:hypothetical protein
MKRGLLVVEREQAERIIFPNVHDTRSHSISFSHNMAASDPTTESQQPQASSSTAPPPAESTPSSSVSPQMEDALKLYRQVITPFPPPSSARGSTDG